MARRSTIDKLPENVRRWLERALNESGFSGYSELESLLREQGYVISKSAIHRYVVVKFSMPLQVTMA